MGRIPTARAVSRLTAWEQQPPWIHPVARRSGTGHHRHRHHVRRLVRGRCVADHRRAARRPAASASSRDRRGGRVVTRPPRPGGQANSSMEERDGHPRRARAKERPARATKRSERFDPDRGPQLSSFVTPTITGELKRHFRDRGWAVSVLRREPRPARYGGSFPRGGSVALESGRSTHCATTRPQKHSGFAAPGSGYGCHRHMSAEAASAWGPTDADLASRAPHAVPARVAELVAWAAMVDPGPDPSPAQHDRAVGALGEAADGEGELVHRAWLVALRLLRDGGTTRSCVALLRSASERLREAGAPPPATPAF
jgi:hypothetical protein